MLEKDIDELHRRGTDVLMSSSSAAAAQTAQKGGDVEMSLLNGDAPINNVPFQPPQQGDAGGLQDANSEWVATTTTNETPTPAQQQLPDKYCGISQRELCISVMLVIGMIFITTISVTVAVKKHNETADKNSALPLEMVGRVQLDPVTNTWVSSYVVPTRPVPTTVTSQQELDIVIEAMTNNTLLSGKVAALPKTVTELASIDSTDPYVMGAQWLTGTDMVNGKEHAINRYALAVFYYSLSGDQWFNRTNWLSPTEYYCDWHGVVCCNDHVRTSPLCNSNDFGKIIEIDLFRNNLIGSIPDVISLFNPSLYSLYLSENSITGTLPGAAIATLSQFGSYIAAYNFHTGTIPVELNTNGVFSK